MEEEVTILDNIDYPDYEQDYEDIGILKQCRNYIITRSDLFNYIKENITDFNSFQFDDHTINQQAPLLELVETLINNPHKTDFDSENILHILHAKHAVMGSPKDPTSYSYSISKYGDLLQTQKITASLNSFKSQLFITNVNENNPSQSYFSFPRFLTLLKDGDGDEVTRQFTTGRDSL
jgi:hypothetical protein